MNSFIEDLRWRGLLQQCTDEAGLAAALNAEKTSAYIGFDPTAASLHVGSLLPILTLRRIQQAGHVPIAVVGGGTGLIGDPSGKQAERQLQTTETIAHNKAGIREQLSRFLTFEGPCAALMIDNAEWLCELKLTDFLRDVGKFFSVNAMIQRDSVKTRLEAREQGISFTEFSYMLLQAYDFKVLYERAGCTLQLGGSDQWGNIVSGIDLIRRAGHQRPAFGLTMPLVMTSSGVKFGKTESGAVWLDAAMTSPYRFYQFWVNVDDADVGRYLRFFTFRTKDEIEALEQEHANAPHKREGQRALARDVTTLVHGGSAMQAAERASKVLFGGSMEGLNAAELREIFDEVPSVTLGAERFAGDGIAIGDLLVESGFYTSKGEVKRDLQGGAISVQGCKVGADPSAKIARDRATEGQVLVLRKGKKDYRLVVIMA